MSPEVGWMESLQAEVAPFGINTTIVNPLKGVLIQRRPLRRMGRRPSVHSAITPTSIMHTRPGRN